MHVPKIIASFALALAAIGADTSSPAPPGLAPMFTAAQAHDGHAAYAQNCAKCHDASLRGGSAPDLFGPSFTASRLSMSGLNREVTHEMPLDNPGNLTPVQYAAIIAYLLAANCYAPGSTPYPSDGVTVPNRTEKVATQNGATTPCAVP